jgi:SAM-dependent methyltransferase
MQYYKTQEMGENKTDIEKELQDHISWVYKDDNFWKMIEKEGKKRNIFIVDLGCGGGALVSILKEKFNYQNFQLIDIDDYRKEEARLHKFHKVDLNLEKLPLLDNVADMIFAIDVLEHLENPIHFIHEVERILKPGGVFILSFPNGWNIFSRIMFLLHGNVEGYKPSNNHISFLPKSIFWKFFKNFEILNVIYNRRWRGRYFPFHFLIFPYPKSEIFSSKVCYFLRKK